MKKGLLHKPVTVFGPILDKIVLTHFVVIGLPAVLYYFILESDGNLLWLHILIPVLYFVTSIVVIGEAVSTAITYGRWRTVQNPKFGLIQRFLRAPRTQARMSLPASTSPLPKCSLILAAYLPNEQHIILNTLDYILGTIERPEGGLEIILAYNRPERLSVEDQLEHLCEQHPELKLLCVEGSRSKAENINAALEIVTGEVTGILDADHHPNPDCFTRAWRWLANYQYTAVQGRNVIRNQDVNFMSRMIAVEFECIYGVSHPAKSLLVDTGVFCGSNGYWRTSVLKRVGFSSRMLTEDIDASFRTLLSGHNIVHDPSIITTELAPVDVRSFWSQRKRWAQGWLEVTLKYQFRLLRTRRLDSWQKFYWTLLLVYSAGFHFIALQMFPITLSLTLTGSTPPALAPEYIWTMTILTLASGPLQTLAAWFVRTDVVKQSARDFWIYCLFIPFYCVFKSVIAITAIYDHMLGHKEWVVTGRGLMDSLPSAGQILTKRLNG
jgi:cellulose synthase/poly-beta-1,6-N-acetylglucosamine synthase-like glycosyltransferase